MKKIQKLIGVILLASVVMTTSFGTSIANAKTNTNNLKNVKAFNTKEEYVNFFNKHNVPKDKQQGLLEKLDKDILWDAYNPEKIKEVPESFNTFSIDDPVDNIRYYRFEDGSFIAIETRASEETKRLRQTEKPSIKNNLQAAVSDGMKTESVVSDSFGSQYTDHMVSKWVGAANAGFRSSFYIARWGTSSFNGISWDQYASGLGCSGAPEIQYVREKEEVASPYNRAALRRIFWQANATVNVAWETKGISLGASIPVGTTMSLYLALVNNSYYVNSALPSNIYN